MRKLFCGVVLAFVALAGVVLPAKDGADPDAVKAVVGHFLTAMGAGNTAAVRAMFAPNATVSHPTKAEGKVVMVNQTFEAWMAARLAGPPRPRFREPVNAFTVHVDDGLAFVRADTNLYIDDELRANNFDYFTLIKFDGVWKFVNASFVSHPVAKEPKGP